MVCLWWVLAALQLALATEHRLPRDVRPRHYDLALLYDLDPATNFSFFGKVDIELAVVESTSKVVLHGQDFRIIGPKSAKITKKGVAAMEVTNIKWGSQLVTVSLSQALIKGTIYTLSIAFYGNLAEGVDGAYVSSYLDRKTKKTKYLVASKFGPISARKAFPCFDEPALKAPFRISIGHHRNFSALSNMPLENSSAANALESIWPWRTIDETFNKNQEQFVWDHFETTPPMSTYLVAWVVSKFTKAESHARTGSKIRIWTRADVTDQIKYALSVAPKVMEKYKEWFGIPYPLPKLDILALPGVPGPASESWGLILNAEVALLHDAEHQSTLNKEIVAYGLAHELAHQWFGNLVTKEWWSDLWLYEGFAMYISALNVASVEPKWKSDNNQAVLNMLSFLSKDESSHRRSATIEDQALIMGAFDSSKGFVLARMLANILEEKAFKEGIKNYLVKYSYSNAGPPELWQELMEAKQRHGSLHTTATLNTVMETWTTQTGYPVLDVIRNYESDQYLNIRQLFRNKSSTSSSWWVPLTVLCQDDAIDKPGAVKWLEIHEKWELLSDYQQRLNNHSWVILNADMLAPYRVNYDHRNWNLLGQTLHSSKFKHIPMLSRVQLVSDALALAWNGQLSYKVALHIVSYLTRETHYSPMKGGLDGLSRMEVLLMRSPEYGVFQNFVRNLINNAYDNAGGIMRELTDEKNLNKIRMQVFLSEWACRVELDTCQETAIELFQSWMDTRDPDKNNPIPLDVRPIVYCTAIARGKAEHWNFLLARENPSTAAAESAVILRALACSEEVWILSRYLEGAITPNSTVRRQHASAVIEGVIRSKVGFLVAKDFIYQRIEDIFKVFVGQQAEIGTFLKALASQFTLQFDIDEFVGWHKRNKKFMVGSEKQVEEADAEARKNIIWLEKYRRNVVQAMQGSFPLKNTEIEGRADNTDEERTGNGNLSMGDDIETSGARSRIFRTSVIYVVVWTFFLLIT